MDVGCLSIPAESHFLPFDRALHLINEGWAETLHVGEKKSFAVKDGWKLWCSFDIHVQGMCLKSSEKEEDGEGKRWLKPVGGIEGLEYTH